MGRWWVEEELVVGRRRHFSFQDVYQNRPRRSTSVVVATWEILNHFLDDRDTLRGPEKELLLEEAKSIHEKLVQVVEGIDFANTPD